MAPDPLVQSVVRAFAAEGEQKTEAEAREFLERLKREGAKEFIESLRRGAAPGAATANAHDAVPGSRKAARGRGPRRGTRRS